MTDATIYDAEADDARAAAVTRESKERIAAYAGTETEDRVAELEDRLVPNWPGPVTEDHFELMAADGMYDLAFTAAQFTTADLAFWLIMHARLGRFPTYEELKTMMFRIEAAGNPIPAPLKRAMSVYEV